MQFDVFNGDADGIFSLLQLRLAEPKASHLITGVKRDIQLLATVNAQTNDSVVVLDISLAKNRADVLRLLRGGAKVFYADHHDAGDIPIHRHLTTYLDSSAQTCTALIIDKLLAHRFHVWAICAAFGDNLITLGNELARKAKFNDAQIKQLASLGRLVNYNGYGQQLNDLYFHPKAIYLALLTYDDPFAVIADRHSFYHRLQQGYQHDIEKANGLLPYYQSDVLAVYMLPDEPWARRVSGTFSNQLANQFPWRAHLVLTYQNYAALPKAFAHWQGDHSSPLYAVSLRAPINNPVNALQVCRFFPTGGGRAAAAGINFLASDQLSLLIERVENAYKFNDNAAID